MTEPQLSTSGRLRHIASRQNQMVKQLRSAFTQAAPAEDGSVAIEGLKLVEEALRSQRPFRALFVAQSALTRAEALIARLPDSAQAILLPDEIFNSAVSTESPQGVAALIQPLDSGLDDLFPSSPLILGCAALQDPGNLGAILRSAEAFGASGVLATDGSVSTANPKVARASAGAVFRLPCLKMSAANAVAVLRKRSVTIAVTSSHPVAGREPLPLDQCDLTRPIAIFIGNEGQGIPAALLEEADEAITIPHSPQVESLNAAIAASIVLYEAQRQRSR